MSTTESVIQTKKNLEHATTCSNLWVLIPVFTELITVKCTSVNRECISDQGLPFGGGGFQALKAFQNSNTISLTK